MKSLSVTICFMLLFLMGGNAFASDKEELLPVLQKMVAEDKTRFGIDVRKCRLECERVYSKEHCISKCAEISGEQRDEGLDRERVEKEKTEAGRAVKYPQVAEKYR